jgi:hypothetical protein
MATTINASITSNGLVQTGDASGNLALQGNGTTGLTINSSGKLVVPNIALGTASAGLLEYDGTVPYFTPLSTQRGIVPGQQFYVLQSGVLGANSTSAQSLFGLTNGVTLSSNTIYAFESVVNLIKTAGTTSHSFQLLFAGLATLNNIGYSAVQNDGNGGMNSLGTNTRLVGINQATATTVATGLTAATQWMFIMMKGIVSINAGGTFLPQYQLTSAPGGAYTTQSGSYFSIYPIGAAGSNISVGTWS